MRLDTLRRRRVPIGAALLLVAVWLATGLRRIEPGDRAAVLDSPLGILRPRPVGSGWHLAPPGLARVTLYPVTSATFAFHTGGPGEASHEGGPAPRAASATHAIAGGAPLLTREGIEILASGTIHYRVDRDRLVDVHRTLGPRLEAGALGGFVLEALRAVVARASYSEISGARARDLGAALGQSLAERFRLAGLVLLSCDVSDVRIRGVPGAPAGVRRTAGTKVVLIGLDGADWNIVDPLIDAGRMPHLARLSRSGVRGRLRTITPMLSPVVWTSIATGVLPGRHGIIDFLASTGRESERVPVTSGLRRVKAIWNILSENGLSVGIVGWWASYPAETVRGFVVSDRVAYQLFGAHPARDQAREGKVYPPDLDALVASLIIPPESLGIHQVARYVRLPADPATLPEAESKLIDDFKTLLAAGDTYARVTEALARRFRPDFLAFYLEGTDTVAHLFMPHAPPPLPGVDPDAARRFGRTVDEYYRHADDLIGRVLEAADPGAAIIVCSDHGFRTGENRPLTDSRIGYGQAADWHRKYGILVLAGGPFRARHELEEASVLDLTPTILALFGLPVAEDMDGRPIVDAFDPAFLRAHPIAYVPTHEGQAIAAGAPPAPAGPAPGAPPPADPQGDRELKERLRSLGYLRQDSPNSHNNRGMTLLAQGRYDEAIAAFEEAIRASENMGIARLNIARAHYHKKDYDAAVEAINEHLARQPRSKEAENLLGNIAMDRGRLEEAGEHFRRALSYEPNFTDARNSLGLLYDRMGREEEAIREFRKVTEVDREYAEAHNNIGVIYKRRGRLEEAAAQFRKAIAADPEFAGSYSNLALVFEQQGNLAAAEQNLREALRRDPDNVAARANYGGLLYTKGDLEAALKELRRAVAIDAGYASAHNNLGAVYGRLGRAEEELAAYRRAVTIDPGYVDARHNLGLSLLRRGQVEEGESHLRRALALDPRYAPAYLNLGRSLLERGRDEEAAELLAGATHAVPGDAYLHALLGEASLRLGQAERAAAAFERSLALRPDQPELRRRLDQIRRGDAGGGEGPRGAEGDPE
jgi:tetratricopeptide (TPR) repeat protein